MRNFLRALLWGMAATVLMLFAWLMVPSSIILRPISMTYHPATGKATFRRIVTWPHPVIARWAHSVYMVDTKEQCSDDGIRRFSPAVIEETVGVPEQLERCLNDGPTIAVLTWSVLVFGIIPMRPTTLIVPPEAEEPR